MKKVIASILSVLMLFVSGCTTNTAIHPNSTPNVVSFNGMQEFSIKAPTVTTKDINGNVTEGPVMETTTVTDPTTGKVTTNMKPVLCSINFKDQTMQAPKTGMDVLDKFVGFLPWAWFGFLASDVAKSGIKNAAKDPVVVNSVDRDPIIIGNTTDADGNIDTSIIYP